MFVVYYLLALVVLGLLTLPLFRSHESKWDSLHAMREMFYMAQAKMHFANETNKVLSDVRFLTQLDSVENFLINPNDRTRAFAEAALVKFARVYGRYNQLGLLNARGEELLRIDSRDGTVKTVPESGLDKAAAAPVLRDPLIQPGGIAVDFHLAGLNETSGDTARGVPINIIVSISHGNGDLLGLLVFDYNLQRLVDAYAEVLSLYSDHQVMLVDGNGQLVFASQNGLSGRLPAGPVSYAAEFPEIWRQVRSAGAGQVKTDRGVAFFSDLTEIFRQSASGPPGKSGEPEVRVRFPDQGWKIVLFTPDDILAGYSFFNQPMVKEIYALLVLFIALLVGLIVRYRLARLHLREREKQLTREHRRLYEDAPCGYLSIDREDNITRVNKTLLEWLGYSESELVGKVKLEELIAIDSLHTFSDLLSHMETTSYAGDISINLVKQNGTVLPTTLSGRSNYDDDGFVDTIDLSIVDATDRKKIEGLLSLQANTDELTGLRNRRAFFEIARNEWARAGRYRRPLTILLFDIDNFKEINDSHGHARGDQVLKLVSKAITKSLRRDACCARYGGDEFIAILPETALEDAQVLADRFRHLVSETRIPGDNGQSIQASISLGIAARSENDNSIEALINRADEALYHAKGGGRNRVVIHGEYA